MTSTHLDRADAELYFDELQAAHQDLQQVRSIIADAVKQLSYGFEEIAGQSISEQELISRTLAQVDSDSVVGDSVAGFVAQSEALINRVAEGLNQASQRTMKLAHTLKDVDTAFVNLGRLSESVHDVSEQVRMLAFNAKLEAGRAGEKGRGFSVVATSVQSLSNEFRQLSGQIRDTVERARQTLGDAVGAASIAADADQCLVRTTRSEAGLLDEHAAALNRNIAKSLAGVGKINEAVQDGVSRCLRGLQFDDLVGQICQAAHARITACERLHGMGSHMETEDVVAVRDAVLAQLASVQHRPVQQTSIDSGDVEFF